MPSWKYEGELYVLHKQRLQCLKCNTIVEGSGMCYCGSIRVDKGNVTGDLEIQKPLNIWRTQTRPYKYIPQEVVQEAFDKVKATYLLQRLGPFGTSILGL